MVPVQRNKFKMYQYKIIWWTFTTGILIIRFLGLHSVVFETYKETQEDHSRSVDTVFTKSARFLTGCLILTVSVLHSPLLTRKVPLLIFHIIENTNEDQRSKQFTKCTCCVFPAVLFLLSGTCLVEKLFKETLSFLEAWDLHLLISEEEMLFLPASKEEKWWIQLRELNDFSCCVVFTLVTFLFPLPD